jgi:hypothetical protein
LAGRKPFSRKIRSMSEYSRIEPTCRPIWYTGLRVPSYALRTASSSSDCTAWS